MTGTYQDPIEIIWQGITLSVSYCPSWSKAHREIYGHDMAHIEIRCDYPPIPITETGYRSHFIPKPTVDALGGLEPFVREWLDEAAKESGWTRERQMSLF